MYSDHAKRRMKQRGIEEWEVEHLLKHPPYTQKSSEGRISIVGECRNRTIKVIFIKESYIKIITVI